MGLMGILILRRIGLLLIAFFRAYGLFYLLKHVFYPVLFKRRNGCDSITRLQALIILIYVAANGVAMGVGIRSASQLQSRASTLAIVNLVPLFFGGRMNIWIDHLGMSLQSYYLVHHWMGRAVVVQGLVHAGLAISASVKWETSRSMVSGVVAASTLLAIAILSLFYVRRWFYEIFIRSHFFLSVTLAGAILVHITQHNHRAIYLFVAFGCWCFNFVLSGARVAYHFVVARCSDQQAGKPRRGLSRRLRQRRSLGYAMMNGPYGTEMNFGDYETVVLFAGGIGIAGMMSYVRRLIEGHYRREIRTRRLDLIWLLERECHEEWVKEWMNELLEMDKNYIFNAHVYIPDPRHRREPSAKSKIRIDHGEHRRVSKFYNDPNIDALITSEVAAEAGRTMVAVCAPQQLASKVRERTIAHLRGDIRFEELEFRPDTVD
ncbi:MAG: hypothetical protein M1823_001725 [Watsoniomyces obsoletus]|nr:MAG: hypothetical protein M1823_001725 [Watsoniomyces obsoletus]